MTGSRAPMQRRTPSPQNVYSLGIWLRALPVFSYVSDSCIFCIKRGKWLPFASPLVRLPAAVPTALVIELFHRDLYRAY